MVLDGFKAAVDGVKSAIEDDSFVPDGFARARHILFLADDRSEKNAAELKRRIETGDISFGDSALRFSNCPTRDLEGRLGIFQSLSCLTEGTLKGSSMPYDGHDTTSFDELIHSPTTPIGTIQTINTQWGTHLVLVEERGGPAPRGSDLMASAADLVSTWSSEGGTAGAPTAKLSSGFGGVSKGRIKKGGSKKGKPRK